MMLRGSLLIVPLLLGACEPAPAPAHGTKLAESLLTLAPGRTLVPHSARGELLVRSESSAAGHGAGARELARIAQQLRSAFEREPTRPRVELFHRVVFEELGFVREVEDPGLEFVLLDSVLARRRGNCVGLGTLYLALAELTGVKLVGVLRPGHFFVRSLEDIPAASRHELPSEGRWRNVELLRRGEAMPDAWYEEKYPIPTGATAYGRPLSAREVLGVVEYNIGIRWLTARRLLEARTAFERATRDFPDLGKAHAGLGSAHHLLGELALAETAYEAARRKSPELPGLERNRALLAEERGTSNTPGNVK